jgi:hypothetical protein
MRYRPPANVPLSLEWGNGKGGPKTALPGIREYGGATG